ncbi:hypothetical protein HBA55_29315 [Pseudomaricurvus alkylphenolicus]|jgi:hypothetical protein|uniref:hypothetical protein n=1 Tax=Pseudomaricurvus alkylphenolicus TaxID=1306991 RepID=UPI00141FBD55|nr:hypothetical protein [Pseudomaricurvus alkylphenolicus]NIB43741.1 hypothetical protein [Pseudomaricurvus alkylphenolicus]
MQYDTFVELHELFPVGRYQLNSFQLRDLLGHQGCKGIAVRVLHLGTVQLDAADVAERLKCDNHPRLDGIKVTCLDGVIIIDEPSQGA